MLRSRLELGYEDLDQLRGWLQQAGVTVDDDRQFDGAIADLLRSGRLQMPRAETWERKEPRPTRLVDAQPFSGEL